jgi:phage shock protein PspC (stress-responsive transcriptional regulator)
MGDLDESHRLRLERHARWVAGVITGLHVDLEVEHIARIHTARGKPEP